MPKTSPNQNFPDMRRVAQVTDFNCGPAVLEMLFDAVNIKIEQNQFVMASGISYKIEEFGMSIPEMITAVNLLAPDHIFWYKDKSNLQELDWLVNTKHYPVGIEWQGVFLEYADGEDDGHYSIVTGIDVPGNRIQIADPFEPFAYHDRTFRLHKFVKRWWDVNEIVNPATHEVTHETDDKMMFIITGSHETFPLEIGMKNSKE